MTIHTENNKQGLVKDTRKIRDEISNEIKDMTFEQERAYLDILLSEKQNPSLTYQLKNMVRIFELWIFNHSQ